ncbi:hypothetical protein HPB47_011359 [Ixodes persulcatus]|uniref:Uncharacterized protein n=1 Tax=Ixodes persulcatus TaxID=34615 RepID=A0AC60NWG6_IXOPE|nr:hypothetical protein HPB47_011359 [Ixodes persulcatus]
MANRIKNIRFRSDNIVKQGEYEEYTRGDGNVVVVKWKDSRAVTLASTSTGSNPVEPDKRWSKQEKYTDVPAPPIVLKYNACMGGVDICDQLLEYYRIAIKTRKWT